MYVFKGFPHSVEQFSNSFQDVQTFYRILFEFHVSSKCKYV